MITPDDIAFTPPCSVWKNERDYIEAKQKICDKLNNGEPLDPVTEAPWVLTVPKRRYDCCISFYTIERQSREIGRFQCATRQLDR
jgi:hypothetical protein